MNHEISHDHVNRQAALMRAKGVKLEEVEPSSHVYHSMTCPPLRGKAWLNKVRGLTPSFIDYTGARMGRLTVVGISTAARKNNAGVCWAVRCDCGAYEHRHARSLRKWSSGITNMEAWVCCKCRPLEQRRNRATKTSINK